jgi:hypothetical protein
MALKGKLVLVLFVVMGVSYIYGKYQDGEIKAKENANKEREKKALITNFKNNKLSILQGINKQIELGNYSDALALTLKWQATGERDVNELFKIAKTGVLVTELKGIPVEQYQKNLNLYAELSKINPNTTQYDSKIKFYTDKVNQEKVKLDAIATRQKLLESGFSKWDGSHLALERHIIKSMNDPDSYEHVDTSYIDYKNHLIVLTKFRGKNAFGGTVVNSISAKVSIDGEIIEIIQ